MSTTSYPGARSFFVSSVRRRPDGADRGVDVQAPALELARHAVGEQLPFGGRHGGRHDEIRPAHRHDGAVGQEAVVSVTDTGSGIDAEHLPHIFDRFYRADPSRSRATGGTGLGLAITRHLIEGHRGTVGVTSEPGRGSTFTIRLPIGATGAADHDLGLARTDLRSRR